MGHINKQMLWRLFRDYLIRKEKESHIPYSCSNYNSGGYHSNIIDITGYKGTIFFYEWSDPNRPPISFYNIQAFIDFLNKSDIFIPPFQKDMIMNLDKSFITCKKGEKKLIIRGTKNGLVEALGRADAPGISINDLPQRPGPQLMLPYHVQCCYPPNSPQRMSPMYNYHGNPDEWYG